MSRFALLLLPLAGCFPGVEGVWLFDVPFPTDGEDPCVDAGTENFLEASFDEEVVPSTDWTFSAAASGSDTLYFGQIVTTTGGEAVLLLDDETFPGTKEDGVWVFTWSDVQNTVNTATHVDGYSFEEETEIVSEVRFRFEPDGATATGKIDATSEELERFAETDEWSFEAVGLPFGSIDTNDLEPDDGAGGGVGNAPDTDDCEGETCTITRTTTCSSASPFEATRTDHDPDAYEYLVDAGQ